MQGRSNKSEKKKNKKLQRYFGGSYHLIFLWIDKFISKGRFRYLRAWHNVIAENSELFSEEEFNLALIWRISQVHLSWGLRWENWVSPRIVANTPNIWYYSKDSNH